MLFRIFPCCIITPENSFFDFYKIASTMKLKLRTEFRRTALATLALATFVPATLAADEQVTITEDTVYKYNSTDWEESNNFYKSFAAETITYTSSPENTHSLTFTQGDMGAFVNEKSTSGFDAFVFKNLNTLKFCDIIHLDDYWAAARRSGMALYSKNGNIVVSDNTTVSFDKLIAGKGSGGAITSQEGDIILSGNNKLSFTNNACGTIEASTVSGGAIANMSGNTMLIGNGDVIFSGNSARYNSYGGGAIFTLDGNITIANNESVTFEKNVRYTTSNDNYRLNSISLGSATNPPTLSISAKEGGTVTFKDSITSTGNLVLNQTYSDGETSIAQTGKIIFNGASAEADLNAYFTANNIERTATEDEITASRTSEIGGTMTLEAGTLSLEEAVRLDVKGATAINNAGTTLMVDSSSTLASGGAITVGSGATLANGGTITADSLSLGADSTLTFYIDSLDDPSANITVDSITGLAGANVQLLLTDELAAQLFKSLEKLNETSVGEIDLSDLLTVGGSASTELQDKLESSSGIIAGANGEYIELISVVDGTATVRYVPEPATATLSLLALAGLAARRRRR